MNTPLSDLTLQKGADAKAALEANKLLRDNLIKTKMSKDEEEAADPKKTKDEAD